MIKKLIIILILISILSTGCINNNEDNSKNHQINENPVEVRNATSEDLELFIVTQDKLITNYSSEININITLKNISNDTVKIMDIFSVYYNLGRLLIKLPTNVTQEVFVRHHDYFVYETINFTPEDIKETTFNLNDKYLDCYYMNESHNRFESFNLTDYGKGKYTLQMKYHLVQSELYSNKIEFEII